MTGFDPDVLLKVLHRHDVEYVLIGGLAAALRPVAVTVCAGSGPEIGAGSM